MDRAEVARRRRRGLTVAVLIWAGVGLALVLLLQIHFTSPRDFLWGVLCGSLLSIATFYLSRWSWDRAQWLEWFSRQ